MVLVVFFERAVVGKRHFDRVCQTHGRFCPDFHPQTLQVFARRNVA